MSRPGSIKLTPLLFGRNRSIAMPRKVGKLGRDGTRRFGAGAEIDLVLEMPGGKRWAVEIKRGLAPKLDKEFHHARQDLERERSCIRATSEAIACGLRGGLEMETMLGVIDASSGQSFVSSRMFPALASERFDSGGVATLLEKDVSRSWMRRASRYRCRPYAPDGVGVRALAPEVDQTRVYAYIRDGA